MSVEILMSLKVNLLKDGRIMMIEITPTVDKLIELMKKAQFSTETALLIGTNLKTEDQQKEMIAYLEKYKDIMTDHQAIQHLKKMLFRAEKEKQEKTQ